MFNADTISTLRRCLLGATGVLTLSYGVLALAQNDPQPMSPWLPGAFGVGSAVLIGLSALIAGRKAAEIATDESYVADRSRAAQIAFWIALFLYPAFAVPLINGIVDWPAAFAAMGTFTGASFLLLFVWFDLRGRG